VEARGQALDPFVKERNVDDVDAFERLGQLSEKKLDGLIDVLVVELVTAHLERPTPLVVRLTQEPNADWLGSLQKIQRAHLVTELKGPVHAHRRRTGRRASLLRNWPSSLPMVQRARARRETGWDGHKWLPANLRQADALH
jgi:hypothetical protein